MEPWVVGGGGAGMGGGVDEVDALRGCVLTSLRLVLTLLRCVLTLLRLVLTSLRLPGDDAQHAHVGPLISPADEMVLEEMLTSYHMDLSQVQSQNAELRDPRSLPALTSPYTDPVSILVSVFKPSLKPFNRLMAGFVWWCVGSRDPLVSLVHETCTPRSYLYMSRFVGVFWVTVLTMIDQAVAFEERLRSELVALEGANMHDILEGQRDAKKVTVTARRRLVACAPESTHSH